MSIESVPGLVGVLREYQLLGPAQLDELTRMQSQFTDPRLLARELVQRGWLTPDQVNRIFQGQVQELVLGPYRLLEPLAEGSEGLVFKAKDVRMDRIVALKILQPEHLPHPGALDRFHHEARTVAALSHPNIVLAYEADHIGKAHVLAMEYLDGTDLGTLVKRKGPLPVAEACDYIRQAALGLQHAHEHGVVHRNIKPSNLMVTHSSPDGATVAKVIDFCLARFEDETSLPWFRTCPGSILGTADYIAPEQAVKPKTADTRSDVFSLGCSLFYLLTSKPPFPGESIIEKVTSRLFGKPLQVRSLRPEVPRALERVLTRMLARNPNHRYQTPEAVAVALQPFAKKESLGPPSTHAAPVQNGNAMRGWVERLLSPLRSHTTGTQRRLVLAGTGVAIFLAAVLGSLALLVDWNEEPDRVVQDGSPVSDSQEFKPKLDGIPPATGTPGTDRSAEGQGQEGKLQAKSEPSPAPRSEAEPKPSSTPEVPNVLLPKPTPEPSSLPRPLPSSEPEPVPKPVPKSVPKPELKPGPAVVAGKHPVPSEDAQAKADRLIKELFDTEYARRNPNDLRALAVKLLQQGTDTRDDLDARYVLFREARDLAAQAGDTATAFQAVEKMAKDYAIDCLVMKMEVLSVVSRKPLNLMANKALAETALSLVHEAIEEDRYDLATHITGLAAVNARGAGNPLLVKKIEARDQEVRELQERFESIKPMAGILDTIDEPGQARLDSGTYLALGKFLCFMKGHWDKGLPLLAKGSDERLKALADADLAEIKDPTALVKLADGWWELADTADTTVARKQLERRAGYWYQQALPGLLGLTRTRVEKRLALIAERWAE